MPEKCQVARSFPPNFHCCLLNSCSPVAGREGFRALSVGSSPAGWDAGLGGRTGVSGPAVAHLFGPQMSAVDVI